MDPGERQFHLCLGAHDLHHAETSRTTGNVMEQRGLPDASLASDDQDGARTGANLGQNLVEKLALARSVEQSGPFDDCSHLATER
jgi:hypothetical protein